MTRAEKKRPVFRNTWDLLLVGREGQVIPIKHFKAYLLALIVLVGLCLIAIGGLLLGYSKTSAQNRQLRAANDDLSEREQAARQQNDLLMTQLVIAESRLKALQPKEPRPNAVQPAAEKTHRSPQTAKVAETPDTSQTSADASEAATAMERVGIDNWVMCHDASLNRLLLSFKVMNIGSKQQPVSGKVVVVLKTDDDDPNARRVLPRVPLIDGRPSGRKGQAFRIYNYRTVKFRIDGIAYPDHWAYASIYIYSSADGRLLLERNRPLAIKRRCP